MEFVFRLFLLWFTIYTLAICPEDEQLKSPVCRGLAQYRALVIEPYILPPIEHALAHPAVAPYVEKAKPYADYAVRTAKPIAARIHKEFDARVVPQWNKRVVPLYHKYAVPQLLKLDAQTAPYRTRVEKEYEQYLAPYVRRTASTLHQLQERTRPYAAFAAQKTYQGYQAARPYARPVWEKIKAVVAQLAAILGEQRRQFVDPHVQKIWEHVKEMSGQPQAPPVSQARSAASSQLSKASSQVSKASAKASSSLSSVASAAVSGTSAISSSAAQTVSGLRSEAPPVSQATDRVKSSVAVVGDQASSVVSSASDFLKSTTPAISETASSTLSSAAEAASDAVVSPVSSIAAEAQAAVHDPLNRAASVTQEISSAASSVVEHASAAVHDGASGALSSAVHVAGTVAPSGSDDLIGSSAVASNIATLAVASIPDVADAVPSIVSPAEPEVQVQENDDSDLLSDPDLDAFKAELGLSEEDLLSDKPAEDSSSSQLQVETDEEQEARLQARREKTARDRANIESRHAKWETKIIEQIQVNKKSLRKALVAIRKAAVVELKDNEEIRNEVDSLVEDGEKFLRGAEKYLANLRKEGRSIEEKRKLWDRIVGKVEEKFTDRLRQTETVVNGWYRGVLDKELVEVEKLTAEIKDLAERAQADIGLDYAYLDDVTYQDWQRYHDLARRSENFTAHAHSVQDGSHQSPPINPVVPAIQELQDEVQDVISGFNARLRKIKRSGARAFGSPEAVDEEDEDGTASILPIEGPQQTETPAETGVPPVVIGRGKEEVEAALNRIVEADAQKTSSPDGREKVKDADAVARSLKEDIASEETSEAAPLHQEL
ncbi:hypothetical protein BD309DRAFT_988016 [Dichomitus squalens]|uniref:Uncharacterized protein n=1 Tax=Dichomitus squalens TaxID=114155 RepID=A0A4Q9Q0C1_9APHY|nr:hypothetical protein BD309DRAFT_988016 [Dichomitus squalens]TBU60597.1 hypothetical protein BD310DRAFT_905327 [Dichomitus squalens]